MLCVFKLIPLQGEPRQYFYEKVKRSINCRPRYIHSKERDKEKNDLSKLTPDWAEQIQEVQSISIWPKTVATGNRHVALTKRATWHRDRRMFDNKWVSELVYLTSLLNRQGFMGARQWDEGWICDWLEYTGFRTWDPVVWSRVFYRSTKRIALIW